MADANKSEKPHTCKVLTQERLKELLHYDPDTGVFRWRVDVITGKGRAIVRVGDVAGTFAQRLHTKYRVISVDNRHIYSHRAAFLYMIGNVPKIIDHKDCDGSNNSWSNLREATKSQNNANARTQKNNKIGVKGVMRDRHGKKWVAQIKPWGKSIHLGTFDTIKEAKEAYRAASMRIYGEFARTS